MLGASARFVSSAYCPVHLRQDRSGRMRDGKQKSEEHSVLMSSLLKSTQTLLSFLYASYYLNKLQESWKGNRTALSLWRCPLAQIISVLLELSKAIWKKDTCPGKSTWENVSSGHKIFARKNIYFKLGHFSLKATSGRTHPLFKGMLRHLCNNDPNLISGCNLEIF
jgi:hypothetical protein